MSENMQASGGGIGIFGVLFIVFLVLKLTKVIAWSWWWVTAPLWAPAGILIGVMLISLVIGLIIAGCAALFSR